MKRRLLAAALALFPALAPAQANDLSASGVSGGWFCVMNSTPATVRMTVLLAPDRSLIAQGELILNGTSGHYRFYSSPGRWIVGRNEFGQPVVQMQVMPPNVASFSILPGLIGDPNVLLARTPDGQGGEVVTGCRRGQG